MPEEQGLRMLAVHAEQNGLYLVMAPASLSESDVGDALKELGINQTRICEIGDWRTTNQHVAVTNLRFPELN